ncbi:hypothetical protein MmiEs2_04770 [Methanimicrococcus stummii]|uniref:Uncharacterized protein n=1 Tax=Methanimicrococcus stummii TaxID=3028294 RepID=A0AA96VAI9_9EURY|nr:hypothetical protein MmiEs2_04770 [Methanimicrococcus sp. Es2]
MQQFLIAGKRGFGGCAAVRSAVFAHGEIARNHQLLKFNIKEMMNYVHGRKHGRVQSKSS